MTKKEDKKIAMKKSNFSSLKQKIKDVELLQRLQASKMICEVKKRVPKMIFLATPSSLSLDLAPSIVINKN